MRGFTSTHPETAPHGSAPEGHPVGDVVSGCVESGPDGERGTEALALLPTMASGATD